MEMVTKPPCEYGANCYRKNPNHFKEYAHPQDKATEAKKRIDKKEPALKKPKLDIVKEKVERPVIKKEPAKQNVKTPDSTKKMKQTTLNFFKNDVNVNKKSPEALRRSPRKHNLENKNEGGEEKVKLLTSPKKNKEKEEFKKSPNLKKQKPPEKKKSPQKKQEDTKIRTKVDYISDSDEDTSEMLKKMEELEKVEASNVEKKKSPQKKVASPKKNENAKRVRPNLDYISDSDEEVKSDSKSETSESKTASQDSDKNSRGGKKTVIEESDAEEDDEIASTPSQKTWTYIKKEPEKVAEDALENKEDSSVEGTIKDLFLVDMPQDFYSFFDFCKSLNNSQPLKALMVCGLRLVGPFDILAGNKQLAGRDNAVCHWRYYYDPPEFQTVLAGETGFHMGYWRDDPRELPVFVASNNSEKDCIFKIEAENIFGALNSYLNDYIKSCDPFTKTKIPKLQSSLGEWTEKNKITLEKMSDNMRKRQKKVVSKTLHRAGIVVPVEPKTELGYRPLIETEANLKKICKLIMNSTDNAERDALWDNLQPLITAANIANDECDFGNGLELGIDLFCMGSPVFHDTIEHLLSTSYSLLGRHEFAEIIQKHLKNRRKGFHLSVV